MEEKLISLRKQCEQDFLSFVKLVAPYNVIANCHEELAEFMQDLKSSEYGLVLYPRAHRKSFWAAMYADWNIVRNPAISILYLSATADLAESQLRIIKSTLESSIVKRYWKNLINEEEGKREKWTSTEICVDHPKRLAEGTRDSTVKTGGLTTNITGGHCDLIILDDIVVPANNNEIGRRAVESQYSQLQSILNPGGIILVVGTRYDPKDLYNTLMETKTDVFNRKGELIDRKNQWKVLQRVVEVDGEFLWPRQKRTSDGKWFGFDMQELARIRSGYVDKMQFFAQYYNNPNDTSLAKINREMFQYYNKDKLKTRAGVWYLGEDILNVYAAVDFAYSLNSRSDFSTIVTVGVDSEGRHYVLDIDRFQTEQINDYYNAVIRVHNKFNLKKLKAEATAAQNVIVKYMKKKLEENNIRLVIEEHKPNTNKEERMEAVLRPLYEDSKIYHYRGGNCELLEEELTQARPSHDDIKNALADAISIAIKPSARYVNKSYTAKGTKAGRFGGWNASSKENI